MGIDFLIGIKIDKSFKLRHFIKFFWQFLSDFMGLNQIQFPFYFKGISLNNSHLNSLNKFKLFKWFTNLNNLLFRF